MQSFPDNNALSAIIVSMNKAVCKRLAYSFVYRRIVNSHALFYFEGSFDIQRYLVVNPKIELIDISTPVTGA